MGNFVFAIPFIMIGCVILHMLVGIWRMSDDRVAKIFSILWQKSRIPDILNRANKFRINVYDKLMDKILKKVKGDKTDEKGS